MLLSLVRGCRRRRRRHLSLKSPPPPRAHLAVVYHAALCHRIPGSVSSVFLAAAELLLMVRLPVMRLRLHEESRSCARQTAHDNSLEPAIRSGQIAMRTRSAGKYGLSSASSMEQRTNPEHDSVEVRCRVQRSKEVAHLDNATRASLPRQHRHHCRLAQYLMVSLINVGRRAAQVGQLYSLSTSAYLSRKQAVPLRRYSEVEIRTYTPLYDHQCEVKIHHD